MKNEKTSVRVANIAGRVMRVTAHKDPFFSVLDSKTGNIETFSWADIRALAASALTQTADRQRRYHPDVPQPTAKELEEQWRPKSPQARKAMRGKLGKK